LASRAALSTTGGALAFVLAALAAALLLACSAARSSLAFCRSVSTWLIFCRSSVFCRIRLPRILCSASAAGIGTMSTLLWPPQPLYVTTTRSAGMPCDTSASWTAVARFSARRSWIGCIVLKPKNLASTASAGLLASASVSPWHWT